MQSEVVWNWGALSRIDVEPGFQDQAGGTPSPFH